MAPDDRIPARPVAPHGRPLADQLYGTGYAFEFHQAVSLLERLAPEAAPVGETSDPAREPVRFTSAVAFGFPASEVLRIEPAAASDAPARMTITFCGLAGPSGPLPDHVAEVILERGKRRDFALRAFLDIFNHRLVSLLYRARKKHRIALGGRTPEQTLPARILYALIGLGTAGLRGRMQVPDRAFLGYAGLLARGPRTMVGLEAVLGGHFGVPVRIEPFVGHWLRLPPELCTVVGGDDRRNVDLGVNVVVGRRTWDQQGRFLVRIGPLPLDRLRDFLPGLGSAFRPLADMVTFYAGREQDFDLALMLDPAEVPPCMLGARDGARLGWTGFLKTTDYRGDPPEIRIDVARYTAAA